MEAQNNGNLVDADGNPNALAELLGNVRVLQRRERERERESAERRQRERGNVCERERRVVGMGMQDESYFDLEVVIDISRAGDDRVKPQAS